ncbi:two-component sensor histidine kinase [Mucilaginibacter gracilis]|uniref:histidine kinase n=1 Tax=Mucilaginibacter gracilis TaxID=423350 RepID=A0A495JA30_9SPHI|nr:histidine kinase dimerization/phosphoacceptor domain -containing protein [Mucilaginibacter gracilis]RKR85777.1 two-component sensor histidine kinase [Mucilaginibacter gracilis]
MCNHKLSRGLFCLVWIFCFIKGYGKQPDRLANLFKQTDKVYLQQPDSAIQMVTRAYQASLKSKSLLKQVKCLNLLAYYAYDAKKNGRGEQYALLAVRTAQQLGIDSLTGDAYVTLGSIQSGTLQLQKAIQNYQTADKYYRGNKMPRRQAIVFYNLGYCNQQLGQFAEAEKYYLKAADYNQEANSLSRKAAALDALGSCFSAVNDNERAVFYQLQAFEIRKALKNDAATAESANNVGYKYALLNQPDKAIQYLNLAIRLRHNADNNQNILTLQNLGLAWKLKGNLVKASALIKQSLTIARKYNMRRELALGFVDLANLYIGQLKPDSALKYALEAISIAKTYKLPELTLKALDAEIKAYTGQGRYKTAFGIETERDRLQDSLFNLAKSKIISNLEVAYQTRERQRDIVGLRQQNHLAQQINVKQQQFIWVLVASSGILLVLIAIILYVYRQKILANQRVQVLLRELHHRVKNNLQILNGLFIMQIESMDDQAAREALLENQARLTSMNLVHHKLYSDDTSTAINMAEYLTSLINHIAHSFNTTGYQVDLQLNIAPLVLEADKAVAIGLLLNELVVNSFKYNFTQRSGFINVELKQTNNMLELILFDNGPGWQDDARRKKDPFGLKIINLMVQQLDGKLEVRHHGETWYCLLLKA